MSLKKKVYIWLLDLKILKVRPWEDPRRSPEGGPHTTIYLEDIASPYKNEAPAVTGALAQRAER